MISTDSKNEMLVMVLTDLAGICRKVAEAPAVPEEMRAKARELVSKFNSLLQHRAEGTAAHHADGEQLLIQMARFLPRLVEVQAPPRDGAPVRTV